MSKPYILVTNDDGITASGIHELVLQLKNVGEVAVVAPDSEKSAVGHAITISDPIRVAEFDKNGLWKGFAVSGTPADCIKIAVSALLDRRPDLIISGINLGPNTGINVIYSGTVSAATEGTILGIPSIAISLATFTNPVYFTAACFARKLVDVVLKHSLPRNTFLNVNVPNIPLEEVSGIKITRQGVAIFSESFDKRVDPRNKVYYWMTGNKVEICEDDDVDDEVIKHGMISITPMQFDLTNYGFLEDLNTWHIDL